MSQKKKPAKKSTPSSSKKASRSTKPADQNTTIRYAAIGILAVVVVGIIWLIVSNQNPKGTATTPAASGQEPKLVGTKTYSSAPPMTIDTNKKYTATVKMAKGGEFVIQLLPDKAPITVNSFVFLARQGYFDGVTFHRVIDGFMAQGGDPTGSGMGNPGYKFVNEASDLTFDKAGVVAMANSGRDTNGSQFFITFGPYPSLNGDYTIFGQVTSGMDVVNGLTRRDPNDNPTTPGDAIQTVTITEQ